MDRGVQFDHDITGYQLIGLTAEIGISSDLTANFVIPRAREAGIIFSHDIAGKQSIQLEAVLGVSPSTDEVIGRVIQPGATIGIIPELSTAFRLPRKFSAYLGITASCTAALNVGYTTQIMFGSLVLRKARPVDWDETELSCREGKIWDGTKALNVDPVTGFQGKFRFFPVNYNDIYALFAMVSTKQTLRVYGVPYRNCMIWGRIRKRQLKPGVAAWVVEIEVRQDTCYTGQTA